MGMAFLDGKTPCLLVARGTYRLMMVDAYQLVGGKLKNYGAGMATKKIRSSGIRVRMACILRM